MILNKQPDNVQSVSSTEGAGGTMLLFLIVLLLRRYPLAWKRDVTRGYIVGYRGRVTNSVIGPFVGILEACIYRMCTGRGPFLHPTP